MDESGLNAALEAHRAKHAADPWAPEAQAGLQHIHLARAEALGTDPEAEAHLRAAEDCQWAIGNAASGSGEGLASMSSLYQIRARRARLLEALGQTAAALDLWESIAADPNGLGKFAEPEAARLR